MSNIDIKDLEISNLDGNILFEDSESFMTEVSEENEIQAIY